MIFSCENLTLGYDGKPVFRGVNFMVERGDFLCILGENGSGKSTLLRGILGLSRPMKGSVHCGIKQTEIGYLPQQTAIQRDFPATVAEVVRSGCRKDKGKMNTALDLLGIRDLVKTSYRALSGGQQQRVLLARALCAAETLLCLDEPVNGLDPHTAADFYRVIRKLNAAGVAVVMVTHDLAAIRDTDNVLHLAGDTCFFGNGAEYVKSEYYRALRGKGAGQ